MKIFSNFEGGGIKKNFEPVKENKIKDIEPSRERGKEEKFEIPHSLGGYFKENEDSTIDIETKNGILRKMPKDILSKDLQEKKEGELFITFADRSEISKEILNKLLKDDQND
ncbi:MAG: hypothetical protein GWO87_01105 [Xanthomonadaceae bacterium]|nr:hypothetical protein [Rhodospirillaceae bacterium]NIA17773.1 hypothetical protein [Xanthomonadaceae bacterium]